MTDKVRIVGVPQDLGQSLRGVDMGSSAVRYAGLRARLSRFGHDVEDAGNVEVPVRDTIRTSSGLACLSAITKAAAQSYNFGRQAIIDGRVPIFLGGDHSVSIGTIGGITSPGSAGVLWIDAHADLNTPESSPSGNVHGMPLAALMGFGDPELVDLGRPGAKIAPSDAIIIGARNIDPGERQLIESEQIGIYTMREIDERGIGVVAREALTRLSHHDRIHMSLDMDCLDPLIAPGVGTPVPGGLSYREAHLLMEIIHDDERLGSIDVVEINPILDEKNRTATIAVELLASVLGQTIL